MSERRVTGGANAGTITVTSYTHDSNGNMLVVRNLSTNETTTKTYDAFNRLVSYQGVLHRVNYFYRADGLRRGRVASGIRSSYVWDGANIIAIDSSIASFSGWFVRGAGGRLVLDFLLNFKIFAKQRERY